MKFCLYKITNSTLKNYNHLKFKYMFKPDKKVIEYLKHECQKYDEEDSIISIYDEDKEWDSITKTKYCCKDRDGCRYHCPYCRNNKKEVDCLQKDWMSFRINKILLNHVSKNCTKYKKGWNSSVFNIEYKCMDKYTISEFQWEENIKKGCCMWDIKDGYPDLCQSCNYNLKVIKNNLNNLEVLICMKSWDCINSETFFLPVINHQIQNYNEFKNKYPKFVDDSLWTTIELDYRSNNPLNMDLNMLRNHDVIRFGPLFNHPINLLSKLNKLKGVIFGWKFCQDLNCLANLPNLQFIKVHHCYDFELQDKIYNITYTDTI